MKRLGLLFVVIAWVCLPAAVFAAGDRLEIKLSEQNHSGVSGRAVFTDNGDGTTMLRITLTGDKP
ncbi:MAG: hypothetical protein M3281_09310, partial [Chloroflexota bacterium]|nr:hypothetical protein [Chloroflexota bacterium]